MAKKTDNKKQRTSQKIQDSKNMTEQEISPLAIKKETPIATKEESSLMKKEDAPLMEKELDKALSSFSGTSYSTETTAENTSEERTQNPENNTDTSHNEHTSHENMNPHTPHRVWQDYILCTIKQFFSLLYSFLFTIFPDMREIFSARVFINLCKMIRIEHTLFALPFAYTGLLIASQGNISFSAFFFLTLAMFGIRSFSMTLNRLIDLNYDKLNPRTASRELVTGDVTIAQAKSFLFLSLIIFVLSVAFMNTFLLMLAPIPIVLSILYSYLKRYTWACHFVLGAIIALAPIAGELAVVNTVSNGVALLAFGILFWVAGFDILYSCLDKDFDEKHQLYSVPVCFGIPTALLIARFCHINTIIFFLFFGLFSGLGILWYLVWILIALALLWEHHILSENDLSKMNQAFFTINACISIAVLVGTFLG